MDLQHGISFFNILTFSIPLFCLLLSWASSSTTNTFPPSPPPSSSSSILAATETLRTRGYSLFSSALVSTFSTTSSSSPNFSATILAAPDFLFGFSPNPTRLALPRRPSATLLLYHTLQPPSLQWLNLTSLPDGNQLPTLHNDYCLFLLKKPNGDVSFSSSKNSFSAVNIRQPDLYVDDNLAIHGVDGVLDPRTGEKCSSMSDDNPTVEIQWVHRSFLDHAIRVLRRRGFHVAATALAIRRPDLLTLAAVTIFVPSDRALFFKSDGFRYDLRRHVVSKRLRFTKLTTTPSDGTEFETLAPNKTVFIHSSSDAVSVNGIRVDGGELYHNRWIVLYSLPMTLDDAAAGEFLGTGDMVSGYMSESLSSSQVSNGVPTSALENTSELVDPPMPAPAPEIAFPGVPPFSSQDRVEGTEIAKSPSPSPVMNDVTSDQCDVVSAVSVGVDNADLFCPVNDVQTFPDDVAAFQPSDDDDGVDHIHLSKKLLQSDPLIPGTNNDSDEEGKSNKVQVSDQSGKQDPDPTNIAADLFYYTKYCHVYICASNTMFILLGGNVSCKSYAKCTC